MPTESLLAVERTVATVAVGHVFQPLGVGSGRWDSVKSVYIQTRDRDYSKEMFSIQLSE